MSGTAQETSRRLVRRRDLALLAATAGTGLLAGCTAGGSRGPWSDLGAEPTMISGSAPLLLPAPATETRERLETPSCAYRLQGSRVTAALTPEEVRRFSFKVPGPEEDVPAPKDRAFLLAALTEEEGSWLRRPGSTPEDTFRILHRSRNGEMDSVDLEFSPSRSTYLLQVPEDPAPEDAVLEVTTDGKVQTLSLVDGSRVSSEVEHAYSIPDVSFPDASEDPTSLTVSTRSPDTDDEDEPVDVLSLTASNSWVAPYLAAHGWPEGEELYVGFPLALSQSHRRGNRSVGFPVGIGTIELELPDGERRDPLSSPTDVPVSEVDRIDGVERAEAQFLVPSGTETARLLVTLDPYERRDGLGEELAPEAFAVEVELVR